MERRRMIDTRRRMLLSSEDEKELFLIQNGVVNNEVEIILNSGISQGGKYVCESYKSRGSFSFKVDVTKYNSLYIDYGFTQFWISGIGYNTKGLQYGYSASDGANVTQNYDVNKSLNFLDSQNSFSSKVAQIDLSNVEGEIYIKGWILWNKDKFKTHINNIYLSK